jgi:hypothetical protein
VRQVHGTFPILSMTMSQKSMRPAMKRTSNTEFVNSKNQPRSQNSKGKRMSVLRTLIGGVVVCRVLCVVCCVCVVCVWCVTRPTARTVIKQQPKYEEEGRLLLEGPLGELGAPHFDHEHLYTRGFVLPC